MLFKASDIKLMAHNGPIYSDPLKAVKQDGYALQYVQNQTEEICLEAVKQNGYARYYIDMSIF